MFVDKIKKGLIKMIKILKRNKKIFKNLSYG